MPDHDFLFEMNLSDRARDDGRLTALATGLLGRVGDTNGAIGETAANLEIAVSFLDAREWRTTRPLPRDGRMST